MYARMYVLMYVGTYACMYVCVHVCVYVYMYVRNVMYVRMDGWMGVCNVCMDLCMYVCMCVWMYVCMYVYMWPCVRSHVIRFLLWSPVLPNQCHVSHWHTVVGKAFLQATLQGFWPGSTWYGATGTRWHIDVGAGPHGV